MPNENTGGGVVTLTAEVYAGLEARLTALAEERDAATAKATAAERRASEAETKANDNAAQMAAFAAEPLNRCEALHYMRNGGKWQQIRRLQANWAH